MAKDLIPVIEFCRLERAAKILSCEIDDLLQWGAVGAIELCVLLSNAITSLCIDVDEEGLLKIISDENNYLKENIKIGSSIIHPINKINTIEYYIESHGEDDISLLYCLASGLWMINQQRIIIDLLSSGTALISPLALSLSDYHGTKNYLMEDKDYILNDIISDPSHNNFGAITIADVWITNEQIEKIKSYAGKHIPTPEAHFMPTSTHNPSPVIKIPHQRTEASAVARLAILEVAILIKEKYADEFKENCLKSDGDYNITKWAERIIDSPHLFADGRVPLTDKQTIMNVISRAYTKEPQIMPKDKRH